MKLYERVTMVEEFYDARLSRVVWRVSTMGGFVFVFDEQPDLHVKDYINVVVEKASTIEAPNKAEGV